MKTKHPIYFLLILSGAMLMASGDSLLRREFASGLGIIILMYGIYKTSQGYNHKEPGDTNEAEQGR